MNQGRHIGLLILAVAVAAALAYGFWPRPVPVDTAAVARGPLTVTVEEEGKTRVIDRFVISPPVAGFARRIELHVGDGVARGQRLVELEPLRPEALDPRRHAEAEARVAAARSALRAAQENAQAAAADADLAKVELERLKRLCEIQCASEEELDRAEAQSRRTAAALRSAGFAVEIARHELAAARTALQYAGAAGDRPAEIPVTSPVNGRVLKVYRESEGVVNPGEPLLEIGDPRALEVEVDVLSADAVRIKPGARVLFDRWGGDEPLEGKVRLVEPVGFTKISALGVEEQRVLVIVDFVSPAKLWEALGDGYRVMARFILWERDDVLQIPASALFRFGEGWGVFAVEGGKARRRAVEIGRRNGLVAQILSGLKEGETVIVHPNDTVNDGVRVRPR